MLYSGLAGLLSNLYSILDLFDPFRFLAAVFIFYIQET